MSKPLIFLTDWSIADIELLYSSTRNPVLRQNITCWNDF